VPWLSYADGPGGKPLGDPDVSTSFGCLSRRSRIGRRNIGRVRIGLSRRRLARRVPGPGTERRRSWRWCVKRSRGKVRAAFSTKGRVALVATTARRHGSRRLHPGMRVRGRDLRRLLGPRRVIGVRRGKVRFIAVTTPRVARNRRLLRRYLRLAGL
jgi:hypothetical protein